jgi:hypothetical protein
MPEPPRPKGRRPRIPSSLLYPVQRATGAGSKLPPQNLVRGTSGSGAEVSGQARRSRRDRVCRASPRRVQAPFFRVRPLDRDAAGHGPAMEPMQARAAPSPARAGAAAYSAIAPGGTAPSRGRATSAA